MTDSKINGWAARAELGNLVAAALDDTSRKLDDETIGSRDVLDDLLIRLTQVLYVSTPKAVERFPELKQYIHGQPTHDLLEE